MSHWILLDVKWTQLCFCNSTFEAKQESQWLHSNGRSLMWARRWRWTVVARRNNFKQKIQVFRSFSVAFGSPWTDLWFCRESLRLKAFWQISHLNFFSVEWHFIWAVSWCFEWNFASQIVQATCFGLVSIKWVLLCVIMPLLLANIFSQRSHENGFSKMCLRMWSSR